MAKDQGTGNGSTIPNYSQPIKPGKVKPTKKPKPAKSPVPTPPAKPLTKNPPQPGKRVTGG